LLVKLLFGFGFASLGSAIGLQLSGTQSALEAAVWGQTVVIVLWVGLALVWGQINPPAQHEPSLAPLLRSAANVVITVDGLTLGLIYAFVGHQSAPLVVKVGTVSLVVGVFLGLLLYSLVAGKITSTAAQSMSTGLFSLASWSLTFGLLCIVFALVLPPPTK